MLPRLPQIHQLHTSSTNTVEEQEVANEECNTFASHKVEQRGTENVVLPEATLTIHPTTKQEVSQMVSEENKQSCSLEELLGQEIAGVLQGIAAKKVNFSLDDIAMENKDGQTIISAHISCSTSYDNRDNVSKALDMVYKTIEPVLASFVKNNEQYINTKGLSLDNQKLFTERVKEIVTQHMPRETPSISTMLTFDKGKPIFSLGPEHTKKEGIEKVVVAMKKLMNEFNINGTVLTVFGEVTVEEVFIDKGARTAKDIQKAYDRRRKMES